MIRLLIALLALSALVVAGLMVLERFKSVTLTLTFQPNEKPGMAAQAVSPFAKAHK